MDIALKSFDRFFLNFKFSLIFLKEIIFLSAFFGILIIILFDISYQKFIFLIFVIAAFDTIILYSIGLKRRKEIEEIKSVIKAIRKNRLLDENEIVLSNSLKDLEGNIKAMSRRTQRDIASLEKLAQARSDFLGYVSHELRTPIFTIQGFLETLLNGAINDPKVNRTFLEKAFYHSSNLNTLLNDLIDISMIESGLMRLNFQDFNLFNFLDEVIEEMKQSEAKDNQNLTLSEFDKEINVNGDKEKLKQVMYNLLSNAIKYTPQGNIDVIVQEKQRYVQIRVKDSGIGIPAEEIDRIFERFFRTERERTSTVPGTGLGLAIVKHILEAHSSTIDVKSKLHFGSEFSFRLKRA